MRYSFEFKVFVSAILATAPPQIARAATTDAADMIDNNHFFGAGLFNLIGAGKELVATVGTTIQWVGGIAEWGWVLCFAFLGISIGLIARWVLRKLLSPDTQPLPITRLLFWLAIEASYFGAGTAVFTSLPA